MEKTHLLTKQMFVDETLRKYPESKRFFGKMGLCITGVGPISLEQLLTEMNKKNIDEIITNLNLFIADIRREEI